MNKSSNLSSRIHPTAIVHPGAVIGEGTTVGPYSIVGENLVIGKNSDIQEHVVLRGHTTLGDEVKVFPNAVIGGEPQHVRYRGEPTQAIIGSRVILRECVTISRGTGFGNQKTLVGDDAFIMAYTHIAHDCTIGKRVIIANDVQMAGHVTIEDFATIGGHTAITQFCRIGRYCYVGGGSGLRQDLVPFMSGKGNDLRVQGVNVVGLSRAGFSKDTIRQLKEIYKIFFMQNLTVVQAEEKIAATLGQTDEVKVFCDFVRNTKMGFCR